MSAAFITCLIFALVASLVSLHGIWQHIVCYKRPAIQRHTIRVMLMPLIYALSSCISFKDHHAALFLDPIRDCYEAFVLWIFFQLMVQYLGGEVSLLQQLNDGRLPTSHLFPVNWILPPVDLSRPRNFVVLKRGILQFVLVKPFHAFVVIVLRLSGVYNEGVISAQDGYIYLAVLYNFSVMLSMYCLLMFYVTTSFDLEQHKPLSKLLCIKAVIFFSFWQQVFISLMVKAQVIKDQGSAASIQDWIICLEMIFAAVAHRYAFGVTDFLGLRSARVKTSYAIRDVIGIKDLIIDARHTFRGTNFRNYNIMLDPEEADFGRPFAQDSDSVRYVRVDDELEFDDLVADSAIEQLYVEAYRYQGDANYPVC